MVSENPLSTESDLPEPLVIPREDHPVSRKFIDREALKVLYRLRDAGYIAYLVGGGVRDIYLGKIPKDFDISTSAKPGQIRKLFRNSRVIGRRFRLVQVFYGAGKIIEVSTLRRRSEFDVDGEDKVLAANNSYGDPAEDAFRRDLTINAIFYEVEDYTVIDYTGGVADLKNRIVRLIGDPVRRITRDPVRMMRVVRHAARASFTIEPLTWESICLHNEKLLLCPVSRIRDELFKDLKGGASRPWAELAIDCGLFFVIFPFYRQVLAEADGAGENRNLLLDSLAVIDRLLQGEHPVSEAQILSMLLVPWALSEMDLLAVTTLKESFVVSRKIRESLVKVFTKLNIKRSMQDDVARGLATLPLLIKNGKGSGGWPNWLQKKSYFNSGLELFRMYSEATGGELIDIEPSLQEDEPKPARKKGRAPRGARASRGAAFAPNTEGGVFGFRKEY